MLKRDKHCQVNIIQTVSIFSKEPLRHVLDYCKIHECPTLSLLLALQCILGNTIPHFVGILVDEGLQLPQQCGALDLLD